MTGAAALDEAALSHVEALMRERGVLPTGEGVSLQHISGGRSNLTFKLQSPSGAWVLRRPPLGHVLTTAHDMAREYRVLTSLSAAGAPVPVPAPVLLCNDLDVIGAPFYIMRYVEGTVLRTAAQALGIGVKQQASVAAQLVDVLGTLHLVDPAAVGLERFGRPTGFMDRQVSRWTTQLGASRSRDLPGVDRLAEGLSRTVPQHLRSGIIHGDYRLDNCVVQDGSIVAVLDWEMAALGDTLADLGLFAVYYAGLADIENTVVQSIGGVGGYPPLDDLLERYARRTGADLTFLDWYIAFGWFKLAVVLEGIHYRTRLGATVGAGFEGIADLVQPSIERGLATLARAGAG